MFVARVSTASAVSAGGKIPFDTVVAKTNDNAVLVENDVQIKRVGQYLADLRAVLSSTDAATVGIQLTEQGSDVSGAIQTVKIAAAGKSVVALQWPVKVVPASSGVATLAYTADAAVTVDSAVLTLTKII